MSTSIPINDDDDNEPYAAQIQEAEEVTDNPNATEKQQRSAHARVKRLRGRNPSLGVSVFDFDAQPGPTYKLFYRADTRRVDQEGDAKLAKQFLNPFSSTAESLKDMVALTNRPYVLLKRNKSDATFVPHGSIAFHLKRPRKFGRRGRVDDPFEEGDSNLILFENDTMRPVYVVDVVGLDRARNYDAASGTLGLTVRSFLT